MNRRERNGTPVDRTDYARRRLVGLVPFAALVCLAVGCVVPVSPRFEDPEENFPPYLVESRPPVGSIVTAADGEAEFSVTLADPNLADRLYVRWIFDYPTYQDVTRVAEGPILPPSADGTEVRDPIRIAASCVVHNIARGLTQHRLMLAVSDRPFVKASDAPADFRVTTVPKEARLLRAVWFVNLECK